MLTSFSETWWRVCPFFGGCISASGVRDIVRIDGTMNAEKYRQVLFIMPFVLESA